MPLTLEPASAGTNTRIAGGRRLAWSTLLLMLVIVYSVLHGGYSILRYNPISQPYASGDFLRAYGGMLQWRQGLLEPFQEVQYPPFYYVLLRPLAPLPIASVIRIVFFSQFIWYALAIWWMVQAAPGRSRPRPGDYLLATLLMVNFQPFLETVALHKVEGIEFALLSLAIYAFRKRWDGFTGAVVAVAANLKYLPGILGLYFLVKRERRVLAGMLAALALCLVVSAAAITAAGGTWNAVVTYPLARLLDHEHEGNRPEGSIEFQTLSGTVNRWLVGPEGIVRHFQTQSYAAVSNPELAFAIAAVLKLGLVGLYLYAMRRRWTVRTRETQWPVVLCELSLTLIMIFVIAQASRVHYAILLLPAFVSAALLLVRYPEILGWPEIGRAHV